MQRVDIISPVIVGSYEPQQFLESGHRGAPGQKPGHGDRPGAQIAPGSAYFSCQRAHAKKVNRTLTYMRPGHGATSAGERVRFCLTLFGLSVDYTEIS